MQTVDTSSTPSKCAEAVGASRRTLLRNIAAGSVLAAPASALAIDGVSVRPDAELLRLGRELDAAWAHERATYARMKGSYSQEGDRITQAAFDATGEIVGRIEELLATTLDGFKVKARAVSWCYDGGEVDLGFQGTT